MLLHLGLNDLPIPLLNTLEVLLRLLQLATAVEDQVLRGLDLVLDVVHDLRNYVNIVQAQILFINALGTQKRVFVAEHLRRFDLLGKVRVNQLAVMVWAAHVLPQAMRWQHFD